MVLERPPFYRFFRTYHQVFVPPKQKQTKSTRNWGICVTSTYEGRGFPRRSKELAPLVLSSASLKPLWQKGRSLHLSEYAC